MTQLLETRPQINSDDRVLGAVRGCFLDQSTHSTADISDQHDTKSRLCQPRNLVPDLTIRDQQQDGATRTPQVPRWMDNHSLTPYATPSAPSVVMVERNVVSQQTDQIRAMGALCPTI